MRLSLLNNRSVLRSFTLAKDFPVLKRPFYLTHTNLQYNAPNTQVPLPDDPIPRPFFEKKPLPLNLTHEAFTKEELDEAREERLKGLGPYVSRLPKSIIPYAELMRLEKPAGTWLLYLPCTWSVAMAAIQNVAIITPTNVLLTLTVMGLGATVMRGAGCTINDLLDRKIDSKVLRSVERPLASKRVSVPNAIGFLGLQTAVGYGLLCTLPIGCRFLALASLPLVAIYPLCKRISYYPQIVLASCFDWGALLGWAALGLTMGPAEWASALLLYAGASAWCVAYDTIYAHQDKKFDTKVGIGSTALAWGNKKLKKMCTYLSIFQFSCITMAGITSGVIAGPGFITGLGIFAWRVAKMIKTVDLDNPNDCGRHFKNNIKSGMYFSYGLFFDYLLKWFGIF
ncbi:hypothetical protein TBLA_0F00510 [Henningerozyma blattae CBS 6284]|uniref:4-hydroxybenzoate polyprenyltransferase, mitochondrial n=1 Tax=Henningerozyma blattae (strain ATCC 34711 / CBS 6284 / DSM 70876 / NBRC 10599 / NRRL Y-10934 / UCD 77-7) TaxID=1071380 RepID=I2H5E3_HENB6|nr:hypothetical protein TBLA_0F00510 [Tetrapisispora blattae CBS 6284]CCH61595.1 hypothetical protein TBLA_0F00510 [Tetrapisispora blattae CBS 6284]